MENTAEMKLSFIGCGVMAESIIAGLLGNGVVDADHIIASHPREIRRAELASRHGISVVSSNAEAAGLVAGQDNSVIVLCVKPQRLKKVLADLDGVLHPNDLVISIIAGARIEQLAEALGTAKVVRAMPNTPAQIGAGITAWTCTEAVGTDDRTNVRQILNALGKELFVETENMIDMATSLSATGPTYIFMVMEALTDAGVHLGFSRDTAKELVQETMLGSVKFAMESHKHPAELRNMVTSPGGTSAEAIYQMEKGTLRTVLSKAVYAAYKRAVELGK
ncbi:MAG: pyrroline-5-carboxylate reductase [Acidobacteria bacterium]|nr:pyrroline-5-carboxylate reductase [Acidobacteriota bacterium]MCW5948203.1 pyrroline-5-carboxylate reductase [Pyrinomonadaceae bacterium]